MARTKGTAVDCRRPRRDSAELRAEILQAASDVFFEAGYEGTSIEAVIERVGGSKRAIYSYFGGKKELFAALVTEASRQALATLSPEELMGRNLEETLLGFGRHLLAVVMTPMTIALYRTIVAEGSRFPELAQVFFDGGPGRAASRLAVVLDEFRSRGELVVDDTQRAAEHFIGMMRDDLHLKVVLGIRPAPSPHEIEQSVRQATHIFLDGCRPVNAVARCDGKNPRRIPNKRRSLSKRRRQQRAS